MIMVFSKIEGVGKYLPEKILTNFDLEKMVNTSDEWIRERTGIQERRIARDDEQASDMATQSVKMACSNAGIQYDDIDFLVCATNSPDTIFPATAQRILHNLGIKDRPGFDLQAGCTSFCYALNVADGLVKTNQYKNIAVVGVEKLSSLLNWDDRNTCVLFGDGSGAVILSRNEVVDSGIHISHLGGDSSKANAIRIESGMSLHPTTQETLDNKMHYVKMDGQDVFKFAVRVIPKSIKGLLAKTDMTLDQVKMIIPHQANVRIIESAARLLKVNLERFYMNIQKYGNTSSATIPIALHDAMKEGKVKKGDFVITVGFGAGLTYAANLIKL